MNSSNAKTDGFYVYRADLRPDKQSIGSKLFLFSREQFIQFLQPFSVHIEVKNMNHDKI